jgi:hypothetical protein
MDPVIIHSYDDRDRSPRFPSDVRPLLPSRYGSKRVVRAADGYDVATAFIQCSKTYSGTARKFSLLL